MKSTAKAAGLILAAVVLGLMTVQGTYALWNATVTSNPGVVQAADFKVLVNGTEMTSGPLALQIPGTISKGQNVYAYAPITVQNSVNVSQDSPLALKLDAAVYAPATDFGTNLTVKTAVLTPGSTCDSLPAASYAAVASPATAYSLPLPWMATQTICVQVNLNTNTPAAQMGKQISIQTNLTVAQVAPAAK